jgi:uncharacterized protein (UPF0332 family)
MHSYKDFEKVANFLEMESRKFSKAQKEIALRRAISTIYYGLFWEIRRRLKQRGYKIKENQPHTLVVRILERINPKVGKLYFQMKKIREIADYQEEANVDQYLFKKAKYLAKLILMEV